MAFPDIETLVDICADYFEQRGFKVRSNCVLHDQIRWRPHVYAIKGKEKIVLDVRTTSSMPPLWLDTFKKIRETLSEVKVFFAVPVEMKAKAGFRERINKFGVGLFYIDKNVLRKIIDPKELINLEKKVKTKTVRIPSGDDVQAVVLGPGSRYAAWLEIGGKILAKARKYVKIIDPWATEETLRHFLHVSENVNLQLITAFSRERITCKPIFDAACKQFKKDRPRFNAAECNCYDVHDRYFITEKGVWMSGPSIKDAGKKFGTIAKIIDARAAREIKRFFSTLWSKKFVRKIC